MDESVKNDGYKHVAISSNFIQGKDQKEGDKKHSESENALSYRNLTVLPSQGNIIEHPRVHTEEDLEEMDDKVSLKSLSFENVKALPTRANQVQEKYVP